jgi:prepilin-type processing-associated H-X9-DG protein
MVLPHLFNDYAGNAKPWWQQYWHVQLLPYLGFAEPASAADVSTYGGKRPPGALADPLSKQKVPSGSAHFQLSDYGRNPAVAQFPGTPPSPQWDPVQIRYRTAAAAVTQPSKIIMYLPSFDLYPDVYVTGGSTLARDVSRYGSTNAKTAIPVAFFDGHVEMLPRGEIEGATNQVKWYGNFTN